MATTALCYLLFCVCLSVGCGDAGSVLAGGSGGGGLGGGGTGGDPLQRIEVENFKRLHLLSLYDAGLRFLQSIGIRRQRGNHVDDFCSCPSFAISYGFIAAITSLLELLRLGG